jgi:hypothetical protein
MSASTPLRVELPSIGVDAALMELGLDPTGSMEVPPGAFPAGWYTGAPTPGEMGPAIIVGHVNWNGVDGVFGQLHTVAIGARVSVKRADGTTAVFAVTRVAEYPKDDFPTTVVYGDIDHAGLRIITCGGELDKAIHSYKDNIVVFADLVETVGT